MKGPHFSFLIFLLAALWGLSAADSSRATAGIPSPRSGAEEVSQTETNVVERGNARLLWTVAPSPPVTDRFVLLQWQLDDRDTPPDPSTRAPASRGPSLRTSEAYVSLARLSGAAESQWYQDRPISAEDGIYRMAEVFPKHGTYRIAIRFSERGDARTGEPAVSGEPWAFEVPVNRERGKQLARFWVPLALVTGFVCALWLLARRSASSPAEQAP